MLRSFLRFWSKRRPPRDGFESSRLEVDMEVDLTRYTQAFVSRRKFTPRFWVPVATFETFMRRAVPCRAVPCRAMQCNTMQCSAMLCRAAPCHVVPCRAVLRCAVLCRAVPCRVLQCRAVQCSAVPCNAVQCHAVLLCRAVPCRPVPCSAVQCCGMQCSAVPCRAVFWPNRCGPVHVLHDYAMPSIDQVRPWRLSAGMHARTQERERESTRAHLAWWNDSATDKMVAHVQARRTHASTCARERGMYAHTEGSMLHHNMNGGQHRQSTII